MCAEAVYTPPHLTHPRSNPRRRIDLENGAKSCATNASAYSTYGLMGEEYTFISDNPRFGQKKTFNVSLILLAITPPVDKLNQLIEKISPCHKYVLQ